MIGEKIIRLRKKEGLSQEKLAEKLNVSRQTISKWELGETYPDLNYASQISKLFLISLDELTDNNINNILEKRISNTEKLAGLILKLLKISGILILLTLVIIFILYLKSHTHAWFISNGVLNCTVGDKHYLYSVETEYNVEKVKGSFNKGEKVTLTNKIANLEKIGGNAYLSDILDISKYEYDFQLYDAFYSYVYQNNGTCK